MRRSYVRPTTPALRRSRAVQRLLRNAICLTHTVSPSLASFELTGRVRCDIDALTFRVQDGPYMAMVQASHPLGEQFAAGQQEATLTVTRAKLAVDSPTNAFEVRWRSCGCSFRLLWPQLSPKIQTHQP